MQHGRIAAARTHLDLALQRNPGDVTTRERLARLELLHGEPTRAEALYLELMARAPQQRLVANLAAAQLLAGRPREALARLETVTADEAAGAAALVNLGDCLEMLGRTTEAARAYERALAALGGSGTAGDEPGTAAPTNPAGRAAALGLRAQCLAQLGRHAEARASARQALALAPDTPDAAFAAALVAARMGNADQARAYRRRALELGLGPAWFSLPWFARLDGPGRCTSRAAPASPPSDTPDTSDTGGDQHTRAWRITPTITARGHRPRESGQTKSAGQPHAGLPRKTGDTRRAR
jgi:tetratricopeptide (TPR) repeat protein